MYRVHPFFFEVKLVVKKKRIDYEKKSGGEDQVMTKKNKASKKPESPPIVYHVHKTGWTDADFKSNNSAPKVKVGGTITKRTFNGRARARVRFDETPKDGVTIWFYMWGVDQTCKSANYKDQFAEGKPLSFFPKAIGVEKGALFKRIDEILKAFTGGGKKQ